jgi:hypothetical protein
VVRLRNPTDRAVSATVAHRLGHVAVTSVRLDETADGLAVHVTPQGWQLEIGPNGMRSVLLRRV